MACVSVTMSQRVPSGIVTSVFLSGNLLVVGASGFKRAAPSEAVSVSARSRVVNVALSMAVNPVDGQISFLPQLHRIHTQM